MDFTDFYLWAKTSLYTLKPAEKQVNVLKEMRLLGTWKYFDWIKAIIIEFGFSVMWRIMQILEAVICWGQYPPWPVKEASK